MTRKRDICLYDGHCGMCRRTARTLRFLDWFGSLGFADLAEASRTNPMIDPAAAMRGMPMVTREGHILYGFVAVRRAMRQTPVGLLPALLLYLPGVSWVGRIVYQRVADNRRRECDVGGSRTDAGRV